MKSKIIWCLIGMNLALALALILPFMNGRTAVAQASMRPSDYMLVPGDVGGADFGVVYIIDEGNNLLSAMAMEESNGKIAVMPPIDLLRVFEEGAGRRPRR